MQFLSCVIKEFFVFLCVLVVILGKNGDHLMLGVFTCKCITFEVRFFDVITVGGSNFGLWIWGFRRDQTFVMKECSLANRLNELMWLIDTLEQKIYC